MRHVELTCRYHPELRWSCKSIAFTPNRGYNGARSIFFNGSESNQFAEECKCSPRDLVMTPKEIEQQKTEPTYTAEGRDIDA